MVVGHVLADLGTRLYEKFTQANIYSLMVFRFVWALHYVF
jgi:hypothetical protein